MSFIDAEELREELDAILANAGCKHAGQVYDFIRYYPTVSCGECKWYDNGRRGIGCRFCYCGDEFERREP